MEWRFPQVDRVAVDHLAWELGISRVLAEVLVGRGLGDPDLARKFLWPRVEDLHDPFTLRDMDQAVKAIFGAIAGRKKIMIYGHDDTDGITATVLLMEVLWDLGAEVEYYLPNRYHEGTGLDSEKLATLAGRGIDLVVTVDCGITDGLSELGPEVVVVDHHELSRWPSGVTALVNPKVGGYPYRELAGVGVAFKLAQALWELRGESASRLLDQVGDLVVLGTLADQVPQSDENRSLTRLGMERTGRRPGLLAMAQVLGLGDSPRGEPFWRQAVRLINSARSGQDWNPGCELLLTPNQGLALKLAGELYQAAQEWEERLREAYTRILRRVEEVGPDQAPLIVVNEGVPVEMVGTCASRLVGRYNRPAIVLGFQEDRYFGEARAPRGYDLVWLLEQSRDLFIDYGGHPQAAGFSLFPENLDVFLRRVSYLTAGWGRDLVRQLRIDAEVNPSELRPELMAELQTLIPHGPGNPRPLLFSRRVSLLPLGYRVDIGRYQQVAEIDGIEVLVEGGVDEQWLRGIFSSRVDLVYSVLPETRETVRVVLRDYRPSPGTG